LCGTRDALYGEQQRPCARGWGTEPFLRNLYARTPPIGPRHEADGNPIVIAHFHLQRAIASDPQDARWVTGITDAQYDLVTLWPRCILRAECFNKQFPATRAAT
jgi:hypothetical protein